MKAEKGGYRKFHAQLLAVQGKKSEKKVCSSTITESCCELDRMDGSAGFLTAGRIQ